MFGSTAEVNFSNLFTLRRGEQTVGRDAEADVRIQGDGVSRRHCLINWQGDGIWLRDFGSVNGCLVRGVRLVETCTGSIEINCRME
jgi:pSer/pThr/pTyr-binding forkhead associated (FHA) protein